MDCTQVLVEEDDRRDVPHTGRLKVGNLEINKVKYDIYTGDNIIGRDQLCDIVIASTSISNKHAVIEVDDWETHFIYDCGSTNKTRLGKVILKPNARYELKEKNDIMFADLPAKYIKLARPHNIPDNDDTGSETGSESMLNCDPVNPDLDVEEKSPKKVVPVQQSDVTKTNSESLFDFDESSIFEEKRVSASASNIQVVETSMDDSTDEEDYFVLPSQSVKEFNYNRQETKNPMHAKNSNQILTEDVFGCSQNKFTEVNNSKNIFEMDTQEQDLTANVNEDSNNMLSNIITQTVFSPEIQLTDPGNQQNLDQHSVKNMPLNSKISLSVIEQSLKDIENEDFFEAETELYEEDAQRKNDRDQKKRDNEVNLFEDEKDLNNQSTVSKKSNEKCNEDSLFDAETEVNENIFDKDNNKKSENSKEDLCDADTELNDFEIDRREKNKKFKSGKDNFSQGESEFDDHMLPLANYDPPAKTNLSMKDQNLRAKEKGNYLLEDLEMSDLVLSNTSEGNISSNKKKNIKNQNDNIEELTESKSPLKDKLSKVNVSKTINDNKINTQEKTVTSYNNSSNIKSSTRLSSSHHHNCKNEVIEDEVTDDEDSLANALTQVNPNLIGGVTNETNSRVEPLVNHDKERDLECKSNSNLNLVTGPNLESDDDISDQLTQVNPYLKKEPVEHTFPSLEKSENYDTFKIIKKEDNIEEENIENMETQINFKVHNDENPILSKPSPIYCKQENDSDFIDFDLPQCKNVVSENKDTIEVSSTDDFANAVTQPFIPFTITKKESDCDDNDLEDEGPCSTGPPKIIKTLIRKVEPLVFDDFNNQFCSSLIPRPEESEGIPRLRTRQSKITKKRKGSKCKANNSCPQARGEIKDSYGSKNKSKKNLKASPDTVKLTKTNKSLVRAECLEVEKCSNASDSIIANKHMNINSIFQSGKKLTSKQKEAGTSKCQIFTSKENGKTTESLGKNQNKSDEELIANKIGATTSTMTLADMDICSTIDDNLYVSTRSACESSKKGITNQEQSTKKSMLQSKCQTNLTSSSSDVNNKLKQKVISEKTENVSSKRSKKLFGNFKDSGLINISIENDLTNGPCYSSTPFKTNDDDRLNHADLVKTQESALRTPTKNNITVVYDSPVLPSSEELVAVADKTPVKTPEFHSESKKNVLPLALNRTPRIRKPPRKLVDIVDQFRNDEYVNDHNTLKQNKKSKLCPKNNSGTVQKNFDVDSELNLKDVDISIHDIPSSSGIYKQFELKNVTLKLKRCSQNRHDVHKNKAGASHNSRDLGVTSIEDNAVKNYLKSNVDKTLHLSMTTEQNNSLNEQEIKCDNVELLSKRRRKNKEPSPELISPIDHINEEGSHNDHSKFLSKRNLKNKAVPKLKTQFQENIKFNETSSVLYMEVTNVDEQTTIQNNKTNVVTTGSNSVNKKGCEAETSIGTQESVKICISPDKSTLNNTKSPVKQNRTLCENKISHDNNTVHAQKNCASSPKKPRKANDYTDAKNNSINITLKEKRNDNERPKRNCKKIPVKEQIENVSESQTLDATKISKRGQNISGKLSSEVKNMQNKRDFNSEGNTLQESCNSNTTKLTEIYQIQGDNQIKHDLKLDDDISKGKNVTARNKNKRKFNTEIVIENSSMKNVEVTNENNKSQDSVSQIAFCTEDNKLHKSSNRNIASLSKIDMTVQNDNQKNLNDSCTEKNVMTRNKNKRRLNNEALNDNNCSRNVQLDNSKNKNQDSTRLEKSLDHIKKEIIVDISDIPCEKRQTRRKQAWCQGSEDNLTSESNIKTRVVASQGRRQINKKSDNLNSSLSDNKDRNTTADDKSLFVVPTKTNSFKSGKRVETKETLEVSNSKKSSVGKKSRSRSESISSQDSDSRLQSNEDNITAESNIKMRGSPSKKRRQINKKSENLNSPELVHKDRDTTIDVKSLFTLPSKTNSCKSEKTIESKETLEVLNSKKAPIGKKSRSRSESISSLDSDSRLQGNEDNLASESNIKMRGLPSQKRRQINKKSENLNSPESVKKDRDTTVDEKSLFTVPSKTNSSKTDRRVERKETLDVLNSNKTSVGKMNRSRSESISSQDSDTRTSTPRRLSVKRGEQVLFTGLSDRHLESNIKKLGGTVVDCPSACSVLVTDKVRRTVKFLCTLSQGKPVVTPEWINQSWRCMKFEDPMKYLLKDSEAERKFQFCLSQTVQQAKRNPLLSGYSVHATPSVKPPPEDIKTIIESCGGVYLDKIPSKWPQQPLVVSHPDDKHLWKKLKVKGVIPPLVAAEVILLGVLQNKLDIETHRLS